MAETTPRAEVSDKLPRFLEPIARKTIQPAIWGETENQLRSVTERADHPLVDLFALYAYVGPRTGMKEVQDSTNKVITENFTGPITLADFLFQNYFQTYYAVSHLALPPSEIGDPDPIGWTSTDETVSSLIKDQEKKRDEYVLGVVEKSPSLQRLIAAYTTVNNPTYLSTNTPHTPYEHAERRARDFMQQKYGPNFMQSFTVNPSVHQEYQRKIASFEQENSRQKIKKELRFMTAGEATIFLKKTINTELKEFVEDLYEQGIYFRFAIDTGIRNLMIDELDTLKIEARETVGRQIRIGEFGQIDNDTLQIYLARTDWAMTVGESIAACMNTRNELSSDNLNKFMELLLRHVSLRELFAVHNRLAKQNPSGNVSNPYSLFFSSILPHRPAMTFTKRLEDREVEINGDILKDYILWQNILNSSVIKTLGDPDSSSYKRNPPSETSFGLNAEKIIDKGQEAISKLVSTIRLLRRGQKDTPHDWGNAQRDIDGDMAKFGMAFRIATAPWRDTARVTKITELSTYSNLSDLPFQEYSLPDTSAPDDQIYISTIKPGKVGVDKDQAEVLRIFTPEFALLTSLHLEGANQSFLQGEDFTIQYEGKTGHYRIVFTESGQRKLPDNKQLYYHAGIDPEHNADNTPLLAPTLSISQTDRLSEFAHSLREKKYTRIADELDKVIQKKHKGEEITTKDIEQAIYNGGRYVFVTKKNAIYSFDTTDLSYLPAPDQNGKAAMQCAHAAQLFSDILNHVYQTNAFYPSIMFGTLYAADGVLYAGGLPHADTRGAQDGVRIRHDATPTPSIRSFKDRIVARFNKLIKRFQTRERPTNTTPVQEDEKVFEQVVEQVTKESLSEIASGISQRFVAQVIEFTPKNKYGQIAMSFEYPRSVTDFGSLIRELEEHGNNISSDKQQKQEFLAKLEQLRETWQLSLRIPASRMEQASYDKVFGGFSHVSSFILNTLDDVQALLSDA